MTDQELQNLKFPIGKFEKPTSISQDHIEAWISVLEDFPLKVKEVVSNLSDEQLSWRYRPNGWTIAQVVHHCSDSHMNSLIRFKLALTEDNPTIKPYEEQLWAELTDSHDLNLSASLGILDNLHAKWVYLLKRLTTSGLEITFQHPSESEPTTLAENIGIYAWHCNHHFAHIIQAIKGGGTYG